MTLAEKLKAAVRLPTVSYTDHGRIDLAVHREFQELLAVLFPKAGAALKREVLSDYSVLYVWEGRRQDLKPLLFLAHYDVVPPGDEAAWTKPPFAGTVDDEFVWGRGTLDDKQCLLSLLQAAEDLLDEGFCPERTVVFAFGGDEESSGLEGAAETARVLGERGYRFEAVFDEGGLVSEGLVAGTAKPLALIGVAEKGFVNVELLLHGKAGHASMPPDRTAAGRIARAAARIEESPFPPRLIPAVREFLEVLAGETAGLRKFLLRHAGAAAPLLVPLLLRKPETAALVRTSQAVTVLEGSPKENVLPEKARAVVNLRLLPGDRLEAALERFRRLAGDAEVEIRVQAGGGESEAVGESPRDTVCYRTLRSVIGEVFPSAAAAPFLTTGCTDSRHYRGIADAVYRFMPVRLTASDLGRIHGTDERISLENLEKARSFYVLLLSRTAGKP